MYGICNLSIVPLRKEPTDKSEMVSQVLFGEFFTILEKDKNWSKIKLAFDDCEGFVDNKQFQEIEYAEYQNLQEAKPVYSGEVIDFISNSAREFFTIPLGANLPNYNNESFTLNNENYQFEGAILNIPSVTATAMFFYKILLQKKFNPFEENVSDLLVKQSKLNKSILIKHLEEIYLGSFSGNCGDFQTDSNVLSIDNIEKLKISFNSIIMSIKNN